MILQNQLDAVICNEGSNSHRPSRRPVVPDLKFEFCEATSADYWVGPVRKPDANEGICHSIHEKEKIEVNDTSHAVTPPTIITKPSLLPTATASERVICKEPTDENKHELMKMIKESNDKCKEADSLGKPRWLPVEKKPSPTAPSKAHKRKLSEESPSSRGPARLRMDEAGSFQTVERC